MARRVRWISALCLAASLAIGAGQAEENGLTARMPALGQTSCFTSDTRTDRPVASVVLRLHTLTGWQDQPEHAYSVLMRLKGRRSAIWMGGNCRPDGEDMRCGIDCDGGEFHLAGEPGDGRGFRLAVRDHARMQGGCDDERQRVILKGKDFPAPLTLRPAAATVCTAAERPVKEARNYVKAVMTAKPAKAR
jgi:hypothetical protein